MLWHCSAGKDRVGVGTALFLCALGSTEKNDLRGFYENKHVIWIEEMQHMIRFLETKMIVDNQVMDKIRLLYRVKEEYLDIVFETIKKDFGSMDMFMKKALYMNPKNNRSLTKKISCIKMHKMSKNAMYIKFFVDKRFNVAIMIKHADNFTMELFTSLKW